MSDRYAIRTRNLQESGLESDALPLRQSVEGPDDGRRRGTSTEELALARRPNALGTVGVQRQVAAEAPVDEDQVRLVDDLDHCIAHGASRVQVQLAGRIRRKSVFAALRPDLAPASVLRALLRPRALP